MADPEQVKDPTKDPNILGEQPKIATFDDIYGTGKKKPAKPIGSGLGMKAMSGTNTALRGLAGITDTLANIGEGYRRLGQVVLNPSATGINEMKGYSDVTKKMADTAQGAIKGIKDLQDKHKSDELNLAKMKANDPEFKKEMEEFRERALDTLKKTPFEQKTAMMGEIDKAAMARYRARGLDPKTMDRNSDMAQWYVRFGNEMYGITQGEKRERNDKRAVDAAKRKIDTKQSEFDLEDEKLADLIKYQKGILKLAHARGNNKYARRAIGEVLARKYPNTKVDLNNPEDLGRVSKTIAEELELKLTAEKNSAKPNPEKIRQITAAYDLFNRNAKTFEAYSSMHADEYKDKQVLDIDASIDDVLTGMGKYVKKDAKGIPIEDVGTYSTMADQRMDHIMDRAAALAQKPKNEDGTFVDPNDNAEYQKLIKAYAKVKAEQDTALFGRYYKDLEGGVNASIWGTNANELTDEDMDTIRGGYISDATRQIRDRISRTPKRGKDAKNKFVYALKDKAVESYMRTYARQQLGKAKGIIDDAVAIDLVSPPEEMDPDKPLFGMRSGLSLTVGDLADNGLIDMDDPWIRRKIINDKPDINLNDPETAELAMDEARGYTLADLLTADIWGELSKVDGDLGMYLKNNGMLVGVSQTDIARETNSLIRGLLEGINGGAPADDKTNPKVAEKKDLLNPDEMNKGGSERKEREQFSVPNQKGFKDPDMYYKGDTKYTVDSNGDLKIDLSSLKNPRSISGTNFSGIVMSESPDNFNDLFQIACAMFGVSWSNLDGKTYIEAGNRVEPLLLDYFNTKEQLEKYGFKSVIPGGVLFAHEDFLAGGSNKRPTDFIDPTYGTNVSGKMDGMVYEAGDDPATRDGHIIDIKTSPISKVGKWFAPEFDLKKILIDPKKGFVKGNIDIKKVEEAGKAGYFRVPDNYKLQLALYNHELSANGGTPKDHAWIGLSLLDKDVEEGVGVKGVGSPEEDRGIWSKNSTPPFMIRVDLSKIDVDGYLKNAMEWRDNILKTGKFPTPTTKEGFALYEALTGKRHPKDIRGPVAIPPKKIP